MIKKTVSIEDVLNLLNTALELDREAVSALVRARVPCNRLLAEHPTIQVGKTEDGHEVGLLGILNGLFGVNDHGMGAICAVYDPKGTEEAATFERTP